MTTDLYTKTGIHHITGSVLLDTYAGATDDLKLAAAMSDQAGSTYARAIRLGNKSYTFNTPIGHPYDGFALIGPDHGLTSSAADRRPMLVTMNTGGTPWITLTGACYNVHVNGIYFISTDGATQFARAPTGMTAWSWTLRDLSFKGFAGVLGNSSEAFASDLITIEGDWAVLTCYDTPFNIKGADIRNLWGGGMLNIGSGDNPNAATTNGRYLIMLSSLSKANMSNVYLTADNGWRGIKVTGSSSAGYGLYITGSTFEGRNTGSPCAGILANVTGGAVVFDKCVFDCAMASPSGGENGYIQATGTDTQLIVDKATFALNTSPNTVNTPMVYASGVVGQVRVRVSNSMVGSRGGVSWGSSLPNVTENITGGTGHLITADSSVVGP